jgi:hypothetical protein
MVVSHRIVARGGLTFAVTHAAYDLLARSVAWAPIAAKFPTVCVQGNGLVVVLKSKVPAAHTLVRLGLGTMEGESAFRASPGVGV